MFAGYRCVCYVQPGSWGQDNIAAVLGYRMLLWGEGQGWLRTSARAIAGKHASERGKNKNKQNKKKTHETKILRTNYNRSNNK